MGNDLLVNSPPETKIQDIVAELNQENCSACGFSLDDFRKVGRLGCPDCYQVFSREIVERLPSMHKGGVHKGYLPEGIAIKQALKSELASLAEKLESAIESEDAMVKHPMSGDGQRPPGFAPMIPEDAQEPAGRVHQVVAAHVQVLARCPK